MGRHMGVLADATVIAIVCTWAWAVARWWWQW